MLYASVYPMDSNQLDMLVSSVERLQLNDSALSVTKEASTALGSGLRCGFLGHLHMEIFTQRLKDEFNIDAILTTPTVPYLLRFKDGTEMQITNLAQWPEHNPRFGASSFTVYEPMVEVTIVTPHEYVGALMDTLQDRRGKQIEVEYLEGGQVILRYHVPWQEVVSDLHDQTKTLSSGYASLNYKEIEAQPADLVKVEIAVNGQPCEPLSFVAHKDKAEPQGRRMAAKLKDVLERQQFEIVIQAKLGTKILARERIAPYRKDVLTKSGKTVGGGDVSRKKKLLAKQKEGKAKTKRLGSVDISQEAFWTVLSR
jgi:GTP-binding protein LepA